MRSQIFPSIKKTHLISIGKGEKVNASITDYCITNNIKAASLTGIGAVANVEIARFDIYTKTYIYKTYSECEYELISLIGNLAFIKNNNSQDKWFVHTHISFSGHDFVCYGGHLVDAEICAAGEIFLTEYNLDPQEKEDCLIRKFNEEIGLNILHCPLGHKH